nr:hypothetical protein K5LAMBDA5_LOCUS99 [Klebsiella phage vB_Ko_K5lambda5]
MIMHAKDVVILSASARPVLSAILLNLIPAANVVVRFLW